MAVVNSYAMYEPVTQERKHPARRATAHADGLSAWLSTGKPVPFPPQRPQHSVREENSAHASAPTAGFAPHPSRGLGRAGYKLHPLLIIWLGAGTVAATRRRWDGINECCASQLSL